MLFHTFLGPVWVVALRSTSAFFILRTMPKITGFVCKYCATTVSPVRVYNPVLHVLDNCRRAQSSRFFLG